MGLAIFTLIHILISLGGVISGLVVVGEGCAHRRLVSRQSKAAFCGAAPKAPNAFVEL